MFPSSQCQTGATPLFAFLENLSIKLKLFGATAGMLATLGGVAGLAVYSSRLVAVRVAEMGDLAGATERAAGIDRDLQALNAALLRALFEQDDSAVKWVREHAPAIKAELKEAAASAPNADLGGQMTAVATEVEALGAEAEGLLGDIAKTDEQRSNLSEAGSTLKQAQNALARAVKAKEEPETILAEARLESLVERLRVADWRAQAQANRDSGAMFDSLVADIVEGLKPLAALTPESEDLVAAVKDFSAKSQGAVAAIADQSDQYHNQIAPHATHIGALIADARKSVAGALGASREKAQSFIRLTDDALRVVTGFMLLASLVLAGLIVRSITSPLARLTAGLRRLAAGEFDFQLPALYRGAELGKIVAAVEDFRSALRDKARLEAEEAERRHAAEAEAAAREDAARRRQADEQDGVMRALGEGLARMAGKSLSYRIEAAMPQGYAKLRDDFNTAIAQLEGALTQVQQTSQAVRGGAREMSDAADDLSRRTEHQAQELERTSSSLATVTETVRRTAEGARRAREAAVSTRGVAQKSGDVVRRAVEAMGRIEGSSSEIGAIIGVIDEIAFQTNLLALNAGVEAARAGEAGRGFAVVASEVRALAQRSAEAAKQIKALISASSTQVGAGVQLVGEAGRALEQIVGEVAEMTAAIAEIADAAEAQAAGVETVNNAVAEMDRTTQQNAAMVEEATAATRSLRQETEELASMIDEFELAGGVAAARRAA